MFALGNTPRGRSLACLLLCFLQTAAAQTPAVLPNRRYTLVRFADAPGGPAAEYTVRVPENARGSLRLTDLGCPGERYAVAKGSSVLFQTRRVPANASCDDPLGLAQATQAYSDRKYSSGQVFLPPGEHAIRVTPLGAASGDAAVGVFIRRSMPTVVAPPTETTQDVSSAATEGEDGVVTVTSTGYATLLTTLTLPLTTDDGNTVTTTVADATSTVVSVVDSAVIVTETPTPSYTVVTVLSTVISQETLTSETVVEGTTITVTEVVTLTQEVEGSTTVTLPAVTTTREETTTVLATSTALVTATAPPEGTTLFVTTYVTTRDHQTGENAETTAAGSEECTVPVVTSVVDFTSTDTVVLFTTAAPESETTATETSTVETATETVSLGRGSSADDQGETGSTPAADSAATTPETAPADQTGPPPGESAAVTSDDASPTARRRLPDSTGESPSATTAASAADASATGPAEPVKKRAVRPRAVVDDPLGGRASVVVTVVAATPTATVTVSEICLSSTTVTTTATPTAVPSEEPSPSEEASSATQEPTAATTTGPGPAPTTPTRPPPRVCGRRKGGFALVTDRLTFPQAREACRAWGGDLAQIRRFNPAADAIDLLRLCNVTRAWIEPTSINTITKPQCFLLARNHWYEPGDCLTGTRPVLCAGVADQQARPPAVL